MNDPYLVQPDLRYRNTFEDYVKSYRNDQDKHYFEKYQQALVDFHAYLNDLEDLSNGTHLPEDRIATSTFWLIDQDRVVGVVRIRHREDGSGGHIGYDISPIYRQKEYGSQILKLALVKAVEIGLSQVIVTCASNNIPSIKIIEKCNGLLSGTVYDEDDHEYLLKYVIDLTS